jgi:hypothetical protein
MAKIAAKVECLNPNTGGSMNIDKDLYDVIAKAIRKTLQGGKAVSYTDMMDGVKKYIKTNNIDFPGSVGWYGVTVKNDMEARGVIEAFVEKGKKWNWSTN